MEWPRFVLNIIKVPASAGMAILKAQTMNDALIINELSAMTGSKMNMARAALIRKSAAAKVGTSALTK